MLTIALSKGRILEQTIPLLEKSGLQINQQEILDRKLIISTNFDNINVIIVRATDVASFVQHAAADIGIVGKDVLLEHGAKGLFELLDLNIAKCKLMVAAKNKADLSKKRLKIATKYVNCTKEYFKKNNTQIEIIKLYGSVELAPIVGLSHCIVDLVDTGNTLKANNLQPFDKIIDISSRLIVNASSFKTKNKQIKNWVVNIEKNL